MSKRVVGVSLTKVFVIALVSLSALATYANASTDEGARLEKPFTPCRLSDPTRLQSISAECATVSVAETLDPSSRRITLSVARIPAVNRKKQLDPIVLLAGGPGQGAQLAFTAAASPFMRLSRERDILLLDQRGTGGSNPLSCDVENRGIGGSMAFDIANFVSLNERCRERLGLKNNLGAYTTSHAVRDLDAVRTLLGYETLNIYAASYGTRVAQHYARRYPDRVRSMVLDGVVAPETVLGPGIARDAQVALDGIWERCIADGACRIQFGDMRQKTRALQARLQRSPQSIQIPNPRTAKLESFAFGSEQLAVVLRFGSYDPHFAAMLPLVVTEAERGDFRPIGTLFLLTSGSIQDALAVGMHNSVVCSEDIPRFDSSSVDRATVEATYLGAGIIDALPAVCRAWPRGLVDPDFHKPLVSDIPTLMLSGSLDPVTPPADAERVGRNLKNSRHLIFAGAGHGQIGLACMDRVLAEFYANLDPKTLNAQCLDRRMQPPFWLSLAGPAP